MKNEYCKRIIWVKKEDRNKWGYGIIIIIVKIYKIIIIFIIYFQ
jgi:hypothetical protein